MSLPRKTHPQARAPRQSRTHGRTFAIHHSPRAALAQERREVLRVLFERVDLAQTAKANGPLADLGRLSVESAST